MRGSALLLAGILCCGSASAGAYDCRTKWNAQLGEDATGVMWATSGETCTAQIYTGFGLIHAVTILAPPKDGSAVAESRSNFSYRSKPGFIGRDRFVVAIDGRAPDGTEGRTTIDFIVDVSR